MSDETFHLRVIIDVTTYKEGYVVRVVDESEPSAALFDVNTKKSPRESVDDALASMTKVLANELRKFIFCARELAGRSAPLPSIRKMLAQPGAIDALKKGVTP